MTTILVPNIIELDDEFENVEEFCIRIHSATYEIFIYLDLFCI